jgi:hypothetical protein
MRKFIFAAFAFFVAGTALNAQNCNFYFPTKVGTTLEMTSFDKKDKKTGGTKLTIIKKDGNSVTAESEYKDVKGKETFKNEVQVKCENGEFHVNMNNYFDPKAVAAYNGMDVKVETQDLKIPASFTTGQKLPDGGVTVTASQNGFKLLNMVIKIVNRQIAGVEKVTTPAGTFDCLKITYDIEMKMIFNVKMKGVEYFAKDIGTVRSESYDEKGKLQAYNVLTAIK